MSLIESQIEVLSTDDLIRLRSEIDKNLSKRQRASSLKRRKDFVNSLTSAPYDSIAELNSELVLKNSARILSPPGLRKKKPQNLAAYLPALILQDWRHLYPGNDGDSEFYVYAHVDPRKPIFVADRNSGGNYGGMPFYIGKGSGDRAFDLKRNQGHGKIIKQILDDGYSPSEFVKILFTKLSEQKAFEIEAKLIYFFGTIYQKQEHGAGKGCLLNLEVPSIPKFCGVMQEIRGAFELRNAKSDLRHKNGDEK